MSLAELGEFGLIDRLARVLAQDGAQPAAGAVRLPIGDDAAILAPPPDTELVATIDALIEEVHFKREWSKPQDLGWKALAVNVSDLGAMGASPLGAVVSLAVPRDLPVRWIDRLYQGMAECAAAYGCPIVGGDTVRSPERVAISVAALGSIAAGAAVMRSGAWPGDLVCVTGVLGDSGAGLALLQRAGSARPRRYRPLLEWHLRPQPPAAAGVALAQAGIPTAMLDLSDGLASDLRHLTVGKSLGARIDARRLPISDAARQAARDLGADPLDWALYGGEDYQLLFTVPADRFREVPPALGPLGVTATAIGKITRRGVLLVGEDGVARKLSPRGFAHF